MKELSAIMDNLSNRNVNVVLTNDNVSELSAKLNVNVKEYQVDRYYADPPQFNQKISLVKITIEIM